MFDDILGAVALEIEVAESNSGLERFDEDKTEEDSNRLEEDDHGVDLDVVDLLPEAVVELVGVHQEVPAEQSRDAEAEQEALHVDHELGGEEDRGQDPEPLEDVPVRDVAHEGAARAL